MGFGINVFSAVVLISSALMAGLAILGLRERHKSPIALTFSMLMAAASFWAFDYALEISAINLESKLFYSNLGFLPVSLIPVFWILLTLQYFGQIRRSRELMMALLIIPAITFFLVWTYQYQHLFRYDFELITYGDILLLMTSKGPWYLIYSIYNNLLFLVSLVFALFRLPKTPPIYRQQVWVLVIAMLIPMIADLVYNLGFTPSGLDPAPAILLISGLIILLGILRFSLMSIIPFARETIFEHMQDGLIVIDFQGRIVDINPSAIELIPNSSFPRFIGLPVQDIFPFLLPVLNSDHAANSMLLVIPGHTAPRHIECRNLPIYFRQNVTGQVILIHDVTPQVQFEKELRHLSTHDILTGLFNRTYFEDQFTLANYHLPVSIVMIDLDEMKMVNDTLGHTAGDELLKKTALFLNQHFPHESIIARFGGDEFVVLMWQTGKEKALEYIAALRATLAAQPAGDPLVVRMSIGLAQATYHDDLSDLLRRADHAMYAEKHLHHLKGNSRSASP